MKKTPFLSEAAILVVAFLWLAFHHFYGYEGHFGADDLYYARIAHEIASGTYQWKLDDYYYRWGLLLPLAASYKLFGISDLSSALPAVIFTLLTVSLIISILRIHSRGAQIIGVALFLTNPWTLFYSDKIMPDCGVAFFAMAALYICYRYIRWRDYPIPGRAAYIFSAACMGGLLCKETFLLIYPFLLFLFVAFVWSPSQRRFWGRAILIHLFCGAAYGALFYWKTGRALFRFDAIRASAYRVAGCDYAYQPFSETLKRIGWQFWEMLIRHGLATAILFALIYFLTTSLKPTLKSNLYFWNYALAACLLSANFMTASANAYSPLCLDPRHYLFLAPIAATAAGYGFTFLKNPFFMWAAVLFLAVGLLDYFTDGDMWRYTYLPLFFLNIVSESISRRDWSVRPKAGYIYSFISYCILIIYPIHYMQYSRSLRYDDQRQVVKTFFIDRPLTPKNIVVTNEIQKNFGEYYMGFEDRGTTFITYEQAKTYAFPSDAAVYVLNVWLTNFRLGKDFQDLPAYAQRPPPGFTKIVENKGAVLYKVDKVENFK